MSTTIKEKICQDIHLLRACIKSKHILMKYNSKSLRTQFWKQVHREYNKAMTTNPKTIKQIRERFKYLYTNFELKHDLEIKFNRNLHKGNFFEDNRELINTLRKTANECFHKIVYVNKILVIAQDLCPYCYTKQFGNLRKEDFVNSKPVICNNMFDPAEEYTVMNHRITYQEVYKYECTLRKIDKISGHPIYAYDRLINSQNILQEWDNYLNENFSTINNVYPVYGKECSTNIEDFPLTICYLSAYNGIRTTYKSLENKH